MNEMRDEVARLGRENKRLRDALKEWIWAATKDGSIVANPAFQSNDIAWLVKNTRAALSAKEARNAE